MNVSLTTQWALLLWLIVIALGVSSSDDSFLRIATVTDVHIGEGCQGDLSIEGCKPLAALQQTFLKMNEMNLDGVFLTGDLTSSALLEEYQALRDLLEDTLKVPWWPMLGILSQLTLNSPK